MFQLAMLFGPGSSRGPAVWVTRGLAVGPESGGEAHLLGSSCEVGKGSQLINLWRRIEGTGTHIRRLGYSGAKTRAGSGFWDVHIQGWVKIISRILVAPGDFQGLGPPMATTQSAAGGSRQMTSTQNIGLSEELS